MLGSSDYKRIPEPSRLSRSAGSLGSALANRCLHSDCWNGLIGLDQDEDRGKSLLLLLLSRLVVSDSVQRQRRQPTRLPRPWDSPGMNTGVGCHFPLQCMKVKSESEVAQSCLTPSDPMDCNLPGSSVHGIFQARVLEWGAIAFSEERA